jgi:hypothetical protein
LVAGGGHGWRGERRFSFWHAAKEQMPADPATVDSINCWI